MLRCLLLAAVIPAIACSSVDLPSESPQTPNVTAHNSNYDAMWLDDVYAWSWGGPEPEVVDFSDNLDEREAHFCKGVVGFTSEDIDGLTPAGLQNAKRQSISTANGAARDYEKSIVSYMSENQRMKGAFEHFGRETLVSGTERYTAMSVEYYRLHFANHKDVVKALEDFRYSIAEPLPMDQKAQALHGIGKTCFKYMVVKADVEVSAASAMEWLDKGYIWRWTTGDPDAMKRDFRRDGLSSTALNLCDVATAVDTEVDEDTYSAIRKLQISRATYAAEEYVTNGIAEITRQKPRPPELQRALDDASANAEEIAWGLYVEGLGYEREIALAAEAYWNTANEPPASLFSVAIEPTVNPERGSALHDIGVACQPFLVVTQRETVAY